MIVFKVLPVRCRSGHRVEELANRCISPWYWANPNNKVAFGVYEAVEQPEIPIEIPNSNANRLVIISNDTTPAFDSEGKFFHTVTCHFRLRLNDVK
jgi:hypothetical protein